MNIDAETQRRLDAWLEDPAFRSSVEALVASNRIDEIRDAFGTELAFGTAGLRGKMGVGPNRMNDRVVAVATEALAGYIRDLGAAERGVVVTFDTRKGSHAFAQITIGILLARGIRVSAFPEDRPVPELSFAIRNTGAIAGVMITASHNPKEYNGYKVSWEHGGQIGQEIAAEILARMKKVDPRAIPSEGSGGGRTLEVLGNAMDARYLASIDEHVLDREHLGALSVVYDPLYGTGRTLAPKALLAAGVKRENLAIVEAHANAPAGKELGDFDGLKSPNPASAGVLDRAIALAMERRADIVLSTDPDSDRLVAAIPSSKAPGAPWRTLRANETWPVLLDHRLAALKKAGNLPEDAIVVRSWVTTSLIDKVAAEYGVRTVEVPTGFKWIADQMTAHDVLGGFEESDGMSVGSHTREKDAQLAAVLVAETAARARAEGKTLLDRRDDLYRKHGRHEGLVADLTFEGADGRVAIAEINRKLGADPSAIFGVEPRFIEKRYDGARATLPDGTTITVRPSGTEPKVKVYVEKIGSGEKTAEEAKELLASVSGRIQHG